MGTPASSWEHRVTKVGYEELAADIEEREVDGWEVAGIARGQDDTGRDKEVYMVVYKRLVTEIEFYHPPGTPK